MARPVNSSLRKDYETEELILFPITEKAWLTVLAITVIPATAPRAINAPSNAYSIMSCAESSRCNATKASLTQFGQLATIHLLKR